MKTKVIVMTEVNAWSITDQNTGVFRSGNSGVCFLPGEGVIQSFSNLPAGTAQNTSYIADIGFKQKSMPNGKFESTLKLVSLDLTSAKPINWESVLK